MDNELGRKFEQTRAKSASAILDFCHGPKTWIPDACERRDFSASNPPGLNLEALCSSSLHCALYYYSSTGFKTQTNLPWAKCRLTLILTKNCHDDYDKLWGSCGIDFNLIFTCL